MRSAHHAPLTPLAFLERSALVFAERPALVHDERVVTYRELAARVTRLARALRASGIGPGDRVAYLAPNTPALLEAHFAAPLAGAVLVALNTRLAPAEVGYIMGHCGARMLVADTSLSATVEPLLPALEGVEVVWSGEEGGVPGDGLTEDALLARGDDEPLPWAVADEHATISINYTSGTTGRPKGVMYTHRGTYLNALGDCLTGGYDHRAVYLWTLPMFHCNGWCHPWALVAAGAVQVCLRAVRGEECWRLIRRHGVTHLCGAPTVLRILADAPSASRLEREVTVLTAAAPPNPAVMAELGALGFRIVHLYGLTETYGPYAVCQPQVGWEDSSPGELATLLSRQGVAMVMADPLRVVDAEGRDVPRDGRTLGEVVMSGNGVMKGYHDDPEATAHAFRGGVFHSGDLAVWHPDGYVELRDRAKDVVISGGENISTIEVEIALLSHPAVHQAAVVAVPDERWGERPKAFVVLRPGASATAEGLRAHVRTRLAAFKCPDRVELLDALPVTSTGKVQKYVLRAAEWEGRERGIN